MKNDFWVIVDTETDGLQSPIHVVEVAAQLMHGWEPVGGAFQMLLNHDVPISPRVVAVHGYTREHLRRYGHSPAHVYRTFRDYTGDHPLVAHNLSFDWDRCLLPEWARLGIHPIGKRGFCCLMMARRLALETDSLRLDDLKHYFALSISRSHRALNDVVTLVELFQKIYRVRLVSAGLDTFESIANFSERTPVASCAALIRKTYESRIVP